MAETLNKRGRPKIDACSPEWLAHLRAWCDEAGAGGLTRYQTVPWGKYEALLGLPTGKVGRWHKQQAAGGKTSEPLQLTHTDYVRLCPLLTGWHGYAPPAPMNGVDWPCQPAFYSLGHA